MVNLEDLKNRRSLSMQKARVMLDAAQKETRALTPDEENRHAGLITEIDEMSARIEKLDARTGTDDAFMRFNSDQSAFLRRGGRQTPGDQFLGSDVWRWLQDSRHSRGQVWQSSSAELSMMAATLTEDPASAGGLVVPQFTPGWTPLPSAPLVVADLFSQGVTTTNVVSWVRTKTFTNAAAPVLEGTAKPESALTFERVDEPTRKIAHWIPTSEELLEDAAQARSIINAELIVGVQRVEEAQLLNGDGVAPNLLGILNRAGLAADRPRGAGETNMAALMGQIGAISATTGFQPDAIVIHPTDWFGGTLSQMNGNGDYYIGSPFTSTPPRGLLGVSVAVTSAIAAGTALVGAFKSGGQVWRHGGIRVDASNSHQDFFTKNLVAIRAEERLALIVKLPMVFGKVTNLSAAPIPPVVP